MNSILVFKYLVNTVLLFIQHLLPKLANAYRAIGKNGQVLGLSDLHKQTVLKDLAYAVSELAGHRVRAVGDPYLHLIMSLQLPHCSKLEEWHFLLGKHICDVYQLAPSHSFL